MDAAMTERPDFSHYVEHLDGGLARINLAVEGVTCPACMFKIEGGLSSVPNVARARFNLTNRRVAVEWKEGELDPASVIDRLVELGYQAHPFDPGRAEVEEAQQARFLLRCLGVAGVCPIKKKFVSVSGWGGNLPPKNPHPRGFCFLK
jgi:Cu2+-exporting ATPase